MTKHSLCPFLNVIAPNIVCKKTVYQRKRVSSDNIRQLSYTISNVSAVTRQGSRHIFTPAASASCNAVPNSG